MQPNLKIVDLSEGGQEPRQMIVEFFNTLLAPLASQFVDA